MKVWVLTSQEFQGAGAVWDVYEDVEAAKKDVNLPSDAKWTHNQVNGRWLAYSDLTWNAYVLDEFEVK